MNVFLTFVHNSDILLTNFLLNSKTAVIILPINESLIIVQISLITALPYSFIPSHILDQSPVNKAEKTLIALMIISSVMEIISFILCQVCCIWSLINGIIKSITAIISSNDLRT